MSSRPRIALSRLDEERFGIRIARIDDVSASDTPAIKKFCLDQRVSMVIARCPSSDTATVHVLGDAGFRLMETLVWYRRDVSHDIPESSVSGVDVGLARPGDASAAAATAADAFRDYGLGR